MGRTEPSVGKQPAGFRRDVRAKRAKATANKVIPMVLAAHPRARRGVEASELIVDPLPALPALGPGKQRDQLLLRTSRDKIDKRGSKGGNGDGYENTHTAENMSPKGLRILLRVADTLEAAHSLLIMSAEERRDLSNTAARVGVLNMASPLSPGGGFFNGAQGQEEASLCARTTLLPALRDNFYRLPELGVVFTPDVLVFRDVNWDRNTSTKKRGKGAVESENEENERDDGEEQGEGGKEEEAPVLPRTERWFVDVVSAAMLRLPEIDVDDKSGWATYASEKDRELAASKMRAVMRVFTAKGVKRIVLGAWGCGAYANPVGEIARAWKKVLLCGGKEGRNGNRGKGKGRQGKVVKDSWEGIEQIVFAIKDAGMARAFAAAFGEGFLEGYNEREGEGDLIDDEDDNVEDEKVKELREKIQDFELRVEQARTPQLKAGLDAVLAGLRNQLPDPTGISGQQYSDATNNRNGEDEGSEDETEGVSEEDSDEIEEGRDGHE